MNKQALYDWVTQKTEELIRFYKQSKGTFDETKLATLEDGVNELRAARDELLRRGY